MGNKKEEILEESPSSLKLYLGAREVYEFLIGKGINHEKSKKLIYEHVEETITECMERLEAYE